LKSSFIILIILISTSARSWETDNFTSRRKILKASDEEKVSNLYNLNDEMNKKIRSVIENINENYSCKEDMARIQNGDVPKIYSHIDDVLGGTHAKIEEFAEEGATVLYDHDRSWISSENIYSKNYGLQGSFNLNGHVIGPDKLGHFIDQGFDLMQVMIEEGMTKEAFLSSMQESNDLEDGWYGLAASGVKSYGDMSANFSGLSFYYGLLNGDNPQLSCDPKTNKYSLNYDFDWSDYVNDSWDEGVNCSFFYAVENPFGKNTESKDIMNHTNRRRRMQIHPTSFKMKSTPEEKHLTKYLEGLEPPMSCPAEMNKCMEISSSNCANYFISPKCLMNVAKKTKCDSSNFDNLFKVARNNNSIYKYNRDNTYEESNDKSSIFDK